MRGKADLHKGFIPLLYALIIVARARGGGQNAKLNWAFMLPITAISIYYIFFTASNDAHDDYKTAQAVCNLFFNACDYILLRDRQSELRQIGQKQPTPQMSFLARLKAGFSLLMSPRNIGWSSQPTNQIRWTSSNTSRSQFIITGLKWICFQGLVFDATSVIAHSFPMYGQGGMSFSECGWLWRSTIWLNILGAGVVMSILYTILSLVTVGLGISMPQDWPPLFGNVFEAYTVRKCWGRVWHQLLRKVVTTHGSALADMLGLPQKSKLTTYFKLYVAFLMSGLIHYAGEYSLFQNWSGRSLHFFLYQATAIMFEDAVLGIAKRIGFTNATPLTKLIGFCWVFAWFTVSVPFWLELTTHSGVFNDSTPDVSLVQYLWKGEWKVSKGIFV